MWTERKVYGYEKEKVFNGIYKEFSICTCEMIWKRELGRLNRKVIVKIITEENYRENLRKLLAEEEKKGHLLTEADRVKNMNASPEDFANYLLTHNL
jgi:hypothetical protein